MTLAPGVTLPNPDGGTIPAGSIPATQATDAEVTAAIDALKAGAPAAFDTLAELASGKQPLDADLTALAAETSPALRLVPLVAGAPAAPTGVTCTPGELNLAIVWNANTEADMVNGFGEYRVQVAIDAGFVTVVADFRMSVTGFQRIAPVGVTLHFRVAAIDAYGNQSEWSAGVSGAATAVAAASTTGLALSTSVPVQLFQAFADVGNTATDETTLLSSNLGAARLATNGDKIVAVYAGTMVVSATATRQFRVKLDGNTLFDSTAAVAAVGATSWEIRVTLVRVSAAIVRYSVALTTRTASLFAYSSASEQGSLTLSNNLALLLSAQAGAAAAATNDVVLKLAHGQYVQAA